MALNLYKVRDARDAAGAFFRDARKQIDQFQGIWLVAPDGRVLAAHHQPKSESAWAQELSGVLTTALAAFGPVSPRKVARQPLLPYRGQGMRPDGSVSLAASIRMTFQGGRPEGPGAIDAIELSAADWKTFAPSETKPGHTWTLPEKVGRLFSRCLSPVSDLSTMPKPEEVTRVKLEGAVVSSTKTLASIRYSGTIEAKHVYFGKTSTGQAKIRGIGQYDLNTRRLSSLTLLLEGVWTPAPPYDERKPIAAVIEWVQPRPETRATSSSPGVRKVPATPAVGAAGRR